MEIELRLIDVPPCDSGAPCPTVVADDDTMVFGYREAGPVRSDVQGVVITVPDCLIFKFGAPNDEVLSGHRYAKYGLEPYSAYEVANSEWVHELTLANRVHARHSDSLFDSSRHFIFTFHDSTLEFVTWGELEIRRVQGSPSTHLIRFIEE